MNREIMLPDTAAALSGYRQYLVERERSSATISKYLADAGKLIGFLEGDHLVDKEKLIAFKEWLWEHYKPASCNSIIAAVNQFLESLGAGEMKLKQFKRQRIMARPETAYLTQGEYDRLVSAAKAEKKGRLAMAMETIAMTGARVSELKFFPLESIKAGKLLVRNKGKVRTILLTGQLKKMLLAYAGREKIRSGCIFVTASGRPMDRSNFWREMQKLQVDAKVRKEKIFPHNLRHLFAHAYFELTKDISALGDILGHSNLNVTRIYTMKTAEMQRKTLDKVYSLFIKKANPRFAR